MEVLEEQIQPSKHVTCDTTVTTVEAMDGPVSHRTNARRPRCRQWAGKSQLSRLDMALDPPLSSMTVRDMESSIALPSLCQSRRS